MAVNWLTNLALDEHLKRSGHLNKLKEAAKTEPIIMYPQHFAKRMQISSCIMILNTLTCLYYGYFDMFWLTASVMICSLNHWRFPVIGVRRSIDLVMAQIATIYHIYIAYYEMSQSQWNNYIYIGFVGVLICYGGAIYFGVKGDKNNASKCHFCMHVWGIAANTYLYISISR